MVHRGRFGMAPQDRIVADRWLHDHREHRPAGAGGTAFHPDTNCFGSCPGARPEQAQPRSVNPPSDIPCRLAEVLT